MVNKVIAVFVELFKALFIGAGPFALLAMLFFGMGWASGSMTTRSFVVALICLAVTCILGAIFMNNVDCHPNPNV